MKSIQALFFKFLMALMVLFPMISFAATYYVSSSGNDANTGLSTSLPWRSLAKVNAATLSPGDQVLFQRGNAFYGTLTVRNSGTAGSPIRYGAYGTGSNPLITGFITVSGWTNIGGNIWESDSAVSPLNTCNMVTINGVNTAKGRTPNLGNYYTLQSHSSNSSITSSNLSGTPNWTGAEVVIRKERWIWQQGKITAQSGGTLSYTDEGQFVPRDNWGFFIQNDARTLDAQNEWYFNPSTKRMRVYSATQPTNVQVASVEFVINVASKNYVTIENLTVSGANSTGINFSSTNNLIVQNNTITHNGLDGLKGVSSNYYTIRNNLITHNNYAGIHTYSSGNHHETITDNTLDYNSMIIGIGRLYAPASIFTIADYTLIQGNKIDHSGYNGIMAASDHGLVKNNFINNSLQNRSDGGGFYTAGSNIDLIIDGNVVLNTFGYRGATNNSTTLATGIYLDINTSYTTVSNNTSAFNSEDGIYLNTGTDHNKILNNTVFDNDFAQIGMHDYGATGGLNNHTVTGNKFIARSASQMVTSFRSAINDIPSYMVLSDNNLFARPINNMDYIRAGQPDQFSGGNDTQNLAQWQAFSGHDRNSRTLSQAISNENDLQLAYNETKASKTIPLSMAMLDMNGARHVGSITLAPFTSAILIRDPNSTVTAVAPGAPTSIVATAGDARATVTFAAPVNNGGSAITGYTVTSIPAGGIDSNAGSTSLTHTITGLTNGTTYTFTVRARNSVGTSVASAPSNSVAPKSTVLTPTTAPVITSFSIPSTSSSLTLPISSFSVSHSQPITGYLVNETSTKPLLTASNWRTTAPTSYVAYTSGTRVIYAWAKDGAGNISAPISRTVSITLSNTSSNLCAQVAENQPMNFSCPTGKVVTSVSFASYGTASGSCGSYQIGSCHASNSVQILTTACKGKTSCSVQASNSVFGDPCSGTLKRLSAQFVCGDAPVTSSRVPGAPTSVVATPGNGTASVSFSAPLNNGGSAITGYTVTSIPAGGVDAHAGTLGRTHIITNLKNGTFYTFTVKARNSVGTSVASSPSNSVLPRLVNPVLKP